MKSTGIVRRIDDLGRVVIPKELRKTMGIKAGDPIEVFTDDAYIILKKYEPLCVFCNGSSGIKSYKGKNVCRSCRKEIGEGQR